jgi:hypothetical protein
MRLATFKTPNAGAPRIPGQARDKRKEILYRAFLRLVRCVYDPNDGRRMSDPNY